MKDRSRTWLLIDANYLCHVAWHSTGGLTFEGVETGVAFGLINKIESLIDLYVASHVAIAFDGKGKGIRVGMNPQYKSSRRTKEYTEEEREAKRLFDEQVERLRIELLPEMGFNNVFSVQGYEADDIIASVAEDLHIRDFGVIASGDNDLWQCLRENVIWHNPRSGKTVTAESFRKEWGIMPDMWASVKALAGCKSDDVIGIRGIGEKTAAKWYSGALKPSTKKYNDIVENIHVHNENIDLVRLPLSCLRLPTLRDDEITEAKKNRIKKRLGMMSSIVDQRERKLKGFKLERR